MHLVNEATKIRFSSFDIEQKIKYGVPQLGVKGLLYKDAYLNLSIKMQQTALAIVDEECERKTLWKAREMVGLANKIEKRLKKECY